MSFQSITRTLALTAATVAAVTSALRAGETLPLTVEELVVGIVPADYPKGFSISKDGKLLQVRVSAPYQSNGSEVFINATTGKGQDVSTDDMNWFGAGSSGNELTSYGSDNKLVGFTKVEGKTWAALRNGLQAQPELLFRYPLSMFCMYVGSVGEKMIFELKHYSRGVARERTRPEEDSPPVIGVNTRMRVHNSYFPDVNRNSFVKAYPEAYAKQTRDHYVLFNPKTKELRRILSGNDSTAQLHPSGKKMLITQWETVEENNKSRGDYSNHRDYYMADIPDESELPLIDDLEKMAEADALVAGWFDHKKNILKPIMAGALNLGLGQWSPDGLKFCTVRRDGNRDEYRLVLIDWDRQEITQLGNGMPLSEANPRLTYGEESDKPGDLGRNARPCWTSDSSALLVTRAGYLWRLPVNGEPAENLSLNTSVAIRKIVALDADTWVPKKFGGDILVITTDDSKYSDGLARFNLKTGELTPVVEDAGYICQAELGENGDRLIYTSVKPDTTVQFFSRDLKESGAGMGKQITDFKPEIKGRGQPTKKLLSFKTKNGERFNGILYLPKNTTGEKKRPLLLVPESLADHLLYSHKVSTEGRGLARIYRASGAQAYSRNADIFVRAGYAVFIFDFRLAGDFPDENTRDFVTNLVESAADAAIADGHVDSEKMGVLVFGANKMIGNFTMLALTQTDRFKVATINSGIGMPMSEALWGDQEPWMQLQYMGRNVPWKVNPVLTPERYQVGAAIPHAKSLKTPVLFMSHSIKTTNGFSDFREVPATRAHELFNAANLAGTKSIAAFYTGPAFQPEMFARVMLWFDEHLKGGPALAWRATLPPTNATIERTGEAVETDGPGFDN